MNNEFFRVKGRRAGFDKRPFEAVLSRKSVLYAVRNDDGSLYALIDGPLGEVNLTPSPYPDVLGGGDKELLFDWLTGMDF
jgi:hypothetical protein|tara:strand:+ start:429 stop:668 length:240 start_codon:yes stop_codon:yes gene_type:complete